MSHLFLVGFMGVGKTTIGIQLAEAMNWPFIDLDEYIEQRTRKSIRELFEQDGEIAFREIESSFLNELLSSDIQPTVIASGGGTPCFNNNMVTMKRHGKVIYLEANAQNILKNLKKSTKSGQFRPLFLPKKEEISIDRINFLLNDRIPFYVQSHAICGIEGIQIPDLLTIAKDLLTKSA